MLNSENMGFNCGGNVKWFDLFKSMLISVKGSMHRINEFNVLIQCCWLSYNTVKNLGIECRRAQNCVSKLG